MTTTRIPTWLELDVGAHPERCGVCVEECLALLLGQDKTDHPDRVHPIIRELAIRANDAESDPKKRRLLARTLACQVDTDDVNQEVTLCADAKPVDEVVAALKHRAAELAVISAAQEIDREGYVDSMQNVPRWQRLAEALAELSPKEQP